MAAGLQVDRSELDNAVGAVARDLNRTVERSQKIYQWLNGVNDNHLQMNMGYNAAEITQLRNFQSDMRVLYQIYTGKEPLAVVKDFRDTMKPLWGLNLE
jgi:hypothetical protein